MKGYCIITLILAALLAVGAFFFIDKGDCQFKDFDYSPEDWVTTKYTVFTTDLCNRQVNDKYNYDWKLLPSGMQLKPIARYRYDYVIVELSDGRRGLVIPSTLSGTMRDGKFESQNFSGIEISKSKANRYGRIKASNSDSTYLFIGYMSAKDHFYSKEKKYRRNTSDDFGISAMAIKANSKYYSVKIDALRPNFAMNIPIYNADHNDEFKEYVSMKKLNSMTQQEIEANYGESISIVFKPDGEKRAFYRHIRTKESYNYEGIFINYKADSSAVVENPNATDYSEYDINYIHNDSRPLLSRWTSIDWVDLPLAFPLISKLHLNFSDITKEPNAKEFPYFWIFILSLVLAGLFIATFIFLCITIFFPMKFLSNGVIEFIVILLSVLPVLVIGVLYMELFQGLWIIIAFLTLFLLLIPFGIVSGLLEFERCNACRVTDCVSHTKTLIDTQVSTRVDTYNYDDTDYDYSWSGDTKTKTVTHKCDHEKIETTKKKFRYDFHCSNCNKDWVTIKTESSDRTLEKKTTSHGGAKTTYRKV